MDRSEMHRSPDATPTTIMNGRAPSGERGWAGIEGMSLADVSPVALLVAEHDGQVVFANAAWRDLVGVEPGESADDGWLNRLGRDGEGKLLDLLRRVGSDGKTRTTDQQLLVHGVRRWTRWWISPITGAGDRVVMAVADVDVDHAEREALRFRAIHDPLTGLVNRTQFVELTDRALRGHRRHPGHLAVLYVDLDDFKRINDTHGHAYGDRVLVAVSAALQLAVRPEDVLARIGGDEFAVMCDRLEDTTAVTSIADRVRGALIDPLVVDDVTWELSVSVGVAHANGGGDRPEAILDRADRAMYAQKRRGVADHRPLPAGST